MSTDPVAAPGPISVPQRTNALLIAVVLAVSALMLVGAPLLGLYHGWAGAAVLLLGALFTPLHWALIHEAIHGNLLADPVRNRTFGRILAIPLLQPFEMVRFGHLTHHGFNRHPLDRPEYVERPPPGLLDRVHFYGHLLIGTYLIELFVPFLMMAPPSRVRWAVHRIYRMDHPSVQRIRRMAEATFLDPERVARIRTDAAASLVGFALVLWAAGPAWPWIVGGLLLRGAVISVLDNAPHYGTSIDSGQDATNSKAPGPIRAMLLNQNLHGVHHARPNLPWTALPDAFVEAGSRYDVPWIRMVLRQFAGPLPLRSDAGTEAATARAATNS